MMDKNFKISHSSTTLGFVLSALFPELFKVRPGPQGTVSELLQWALYRGQMPVMSPYDQHQRAQERHIKNYNSKSHNLMLVEVRLFANKTLQTKNMAG